MFRASCLRVLAHLSASPIMLAAIAIGGIGTAACAQLTWTPRDVISPAARSDTAMAYDAVRNEAILFGGFGGTVGLPGTWRWDGRQWTQLAPSASPATRWQHAMVAIGGGQLLMFGGQDGMQPLADTWLWNGSNWIQLQPVTSPTPRRAHAMAYDSSRNRVVLFGGIGPLGYLADTWEWDGVNWSQLAVSGPTARAFHGMAFDAATATGRLAVLLFGGEAPNLTPLNETWTWNGVAWTRRTPATSPAARSRAPLCFDSVRERIVMFGGKTATAALSETWEWNGTTWARPAPNPAPAAGFGHGLCYEVANQQTLLFGGEATLGAPTSTDTWEWNGTAWTKSSTQLPTARRWHAMAFDELRSRTVVFGGEGTAILGDTWEWDGIRWRQMATTGPTARKAYAMVRDPARNRTVIFGGANAAGSTLYNDTWEWDGATWRRITTATSPTAMWQHAMAYDAQRQLTVLFGGVSSSAYLDRTWEYNGVTWVERLPAHRPPAAAGSPMCFDIVRKQTVLAHVGATSIVVWEWDGEDWTHATPSVSPPALSQPTLVYDSTRQRSVLVGFHDNGVETWEWDGIDWQQKSTAQVMPDRNLAAAAYDVGRRCVVVFGGANGASLFNDIWEYASGSFASYGLFGAGCLGSRGVPELAAVPGSMPSLGDMFRVDVTNLPLVGTPCFMFLGFSRTSIGGLPLPLDLSFVSMPGCSLYQSSDLSFGIANLHGTARWSIAMPQNAALLGAGFYNQAFVLDRNANPLGFIVSNAGQGVIGS